MLACTLAIVATLIGCTWWLRTTMGNDLSSIIWELEQLQR